MQTALYGTERQPTVDAELTLEDAQGVLIVVAPIIGTPRTVVAAGAIAKALGFAFDVEEGIEGSQSQA